MIKDYRILALTLAVVALAVGLSLVQAMQTEYADHQKAYYDQLNVEEDATKINQLNIETAAGMQIDRCMTCHIGAANPDAAGFALPIKAHPPIVPGRAKEPHNFQEIGCTVCHDGNGRGLTRKDAHGQFHLWTLPLKTGEMVQSSCSRCHVVDDTLAGAERLNRGQALFIEKACWTCHAVDGVSVGTKGPNLSDAGRKFQVDYLRTSLTDPTANTNSSKMPRFDWVDDADTVEALVIYMKSLQKQPLRSAAKAPVELTQKATATKTDNDEVSVGRGRTIFHAQHAGRVLRGGCVNCHSYRDAEGTLTGNFIGPELTYAFRTRGAKFLRSHIIDPSADVMDSIMPKYAELSDAELDSLVAFMKSMEYDEKERSAKTLFAGYCASCHGDKLDGHGRINQSNHLLDPLPRMFRHQFVASYKGRLQESIKKGISGTAMAPWEKLMTDTEVDQMVAYLESLATKDKKAFTRPNLKMPKVGDLDGRTDKPISAPDIDRGKVAYMAHCTGCHGRLASGKGVNAYDLVHPLPRNLINNKFMNQPSITPLRLYHSLKMGVPGTSMPPFDRILTDQGILDVIAFLQSLNTGQKETSTK